MRKDTSLSLRANRHHFHGSQLRVCAALCGILLLLTSCGQTDLAEVKKYVNEIKARPPSRIEPLPQIKQHTPVVYAAAALHSPFTAPDPAAKSGANSGSGLAPNTNRPREPLEAYPLDSLKMVGTLTLQGQLYALIRDSEGAIHKVHNGNYLGSNYGKIVAITASHVEVNEIIPDNTGGWRLRRSSIALGE